MSVIKRRLNQEVIGNVIEELKYWGVPGTQDVKIDKSININNQHTISQSQTVNIELFKEALKDSLTGKQYKELVEIANKENESHKAIPKIIDKLKSFGGDVASNVVANLLTNPHLYSNLF